MGLRQDVNQALPAAHWTRTGKPDLIKVTRRPSPQGGR